MAKDVYILAADFGLPPGIETPDRVFRTEREFQQQGLAPSLEQLLRSAGERALTGTGLPPDHLRSRVTHLLATTMPEVKLEDMSIGLLSTRLKSALRLAPNCQARFEVGSSDAGASSFATAWYATRGSEQARTTLVLAGQVMPSGSEAIRAISKVLEPAERSLGMNMLAIGDLYMDLFARWWGLDTCATRLNPPAHMRTEREAVRDMIDQVTRVKLRLAEEYRPVNRSGEVDFGAPSTEWFRIGHIAPAVTGGAAVLMTNDRALVETWTQARGQNGRVLRILGVGEGEAQSAVGRRPAPLCFLRSVRQAISALGRDAGVNLDFLRSCSFALLHDAFLSIEIGFLFALGMRPLEALQRQLSFWTNPYGGLTSFGHAIGASGLVQVVKAFHIFTHREDFFAHKALPLHPRFDNRDGRLHALTTSVGGPLTHVVATLLESCPLEPDPETGTPRLPSRFQPMGRHRFDPVLDGDFPDKAAWVQQIFGLYGACYGLEVGLGLLEACTTLDLRTIQRPLDQGFLDQWQPAPVETELGTLILTSLELEALKKALSTSTPPEEFRKELSHFMEGVARERLQQRPVKAGDGAPSPSTTLRTIRQQLFAGIRPVFGMIVLPDQKPDGLIRRLALLLETVDRPRPGTLVRLAPGEPYPLVQGIAHNLPGMRPLWYHIPPFGTGPFAEVGLDPAVGQGVAVELLRAPPTRTIWQSVRALASKVVEDCLAQPELEPPPEAVRLLRSLVLFPDPMADRVASSLVALCSGSTDQLPGRESRVAFCELDLVGSQRTSGAALARNMGHVARAIRRAECWLSFAQVNLEQSGDHFTVTCLIDDGMEDKTAWIALTRFARDVYQESLRRGVHLRAGASVGPCLRYAGIDGAVNASGPAVRAVITVLNAAPEAHRSIPPAAADTCVPVVAKADQTQQAIVSERAGVGHEAILKSQLEADSQTYEHAGAGVFLTCETASGDATLFDHIWQHVGGESLVVLGEKTLSSHNGTESYLYQYRARRASDQPGPLFVPEGRGKR